MAAASAVPTPVVGPVWSHNCSFDELAVLFEVSEAGDVLDTGPGWPRRWSATWRTAQGEIVTPVRDLAAFEWPVSRPARAFAWRPGQRHRPGLAYMSATGRLHGFESLAERRVLLALDFVGGVTEVLSQPFTLKFTTHERPVRHAPDFLALTDGTALLIDVRPADLIKPDDAEKFAAAQRAAGAAGWTYAVVAGWRLQPWAALEALSARRRAMSDPLRLLPELLGLAAEQPRRLGELVAATSQPALARAYVLHLLWSRRLTVDLALPLGDESWVYLPRRG
ncbi:TnsA-like heteromeric transposase endonuclease subunit [Streptomyces sp. NPDC058623]|uniref:TnsA-like heteromeric transposase endonuclease subunit n=1 Tax=Streptomyces sp. NPDC058623 TaxID=3346563 RepID=UPI00365F42B8